jgi:hypothetical protein
VDACLDLGRLIYSLGYSDPISSDPCGKVDAGAVKEIVPDRVRGDDHSTFALAHEAHLLDAVRKRKALASAQLASGSTERVWCES